MCCNAPHDVESDLDLGLIFDDEPFLHYVDAFAPICGAAVARMTPAVMRLEVGVPQPGELGRMVW